MALGQIKRPNALAFIKKNKMSTATQSNVIVPFHTLFKRGGNSNQPQPPVKWLTPK